MPTPKMLIPTLPLTPLIPPTPPPPHLAGNGLVGITENGRSKEWLRCGWQGVARGMVRSSGLRSGEAAALGGAVVS